MDILKATSEELEAIQETPYSALTEALDMLTNIRQGHQYGALDYLARMQMIEQAIVRMPKPSDRQDCLTPAGMEQARQAARASVPCLSPLDDHQTGCVCRECSAHQREEETFATNRQNRIRYGE